MFTLKLFGGASIHGPDGPLTGPVTQRRRLALLCVLALARGRPVSRDRLLALFWPESDTERARHSLADSLYHLRKELGENAVIAAGDELRLNADVVRSDADEFEAALERQAPTEAVAAYTGPLLDGFHLTDAPEFEPWLERERQRLAGAYAKALEALAEAAETRREYAGAVAWWKVRAAHDPYDSRTALRLMQALEASGNPAGALQHAAIHARLLLEEFGMQLPQDVAAFAAAVRAREKYAAPAAIPSAGSRGSSEGANAASAGNAAVSVSSDATPAATGSTPPAPAPPFPGPPPTTPAAHAAARGRHRLQGPLRYAVATALLGVVISVVVRLAPPRSAAPAGAGVPTIAVLPLTNLSSEPGDARLADGMTEEIIARLARTGQLRVIASTSVFAFRNKPTDVRAIADSLGASHVVEGSFQKIDNRLRVHVRLVDAQDGSTLWTQPYDRQLQDVFAVQDDIAHAVVRELGVRLAATAAAAMLRHPTQNLAAYDAYVRGTDQTLMRSDSGARVALALFRQAVTLDSTYAAAYGELAELHLRLAGRGGDPPLRRREGIELARAHARKALQLDDLLADAHGIMAFVHMHDYEWAAAGAQLRRALEVDPNNVRAHIMLALWHHWMGRPADALRTIARARDLDPLSPGTTAELGRWLIANGDCDEGLRQLDRIAQLTPPLLRVAPIVAQCHVQKGQWADALATLRSTDNAASIQSIVVAALTGYTLALAGDTAAARRILERLHASWLQTGEGAYHVAVVYAGLGDYTRAFDFFEKSIDDRSLHPFIPPTIMEPMFAGLQQHPRFQQLRTRLGLQKR